MLRKILFISLLVFTVPAYAYLDSGTGSVVVQMLFAGLAGLIAVARLYWEKVKMVILCIKCWIIRKPIPEAKSISSQRDISHDKTR